MTTEVLIVGRDSDVFAEHLGPQFPKLRFRCAHNATEALAAAGNCEILLVRNDEIFADLIAAMPRLRFIQALTTGTDYMAALPEITALVEPGPAITSGLSLSPCLANSPASSAT